MTAREKRARLTRDEAVEWVMATTRSRRPFAARTVREAEQGQTPYGMTFDGTSWLVPRDDRAATTRARRSRP